MVLNTGYKTVYSCRNCDDGIVMDYDQAKDHVLNYHGVSLDATKDFVAHIARRPRHISIYDIKFDNGIVLRETKS